MIINNPTRNYIYFNRNSKQVYNDLTELINIDLIRKCNLKAHEKNISNFFSRPDKNQEVIDGISLIPPRSRWEFDGSKYYCLNERNVAANFTNQKSELIQITKRLSSIFENEKEQLSFGKCAICV